MIKIPFSQGSSIALIKKEPSFEACYYSLCFKIGLYSVTLLQKSSPFRFWWQIFAHCVGLVGNDFMFIYFKYFPGDGDPNGHRFMCRLLVQFRRVVICQC